MPYHGIAFTYEGQQHVELWLLGVLARCFVGEQPVHRNMLKLTFRALVETADADVANALTVQGVLLKVMCQVYSGGSARNGLTPG